MVALTLAGSRMDGLLEDGGEGGAGVFDVGVDAVGEEGLLAEVGAGQPEAALDGAAAGGFDLLGEELAEDDLLGEVFGADDDVGGARRGARGQGEEEQTRERREARCEIEGREARVARVVRWRGGRNTGVSPLRFASVEMTGFRVQRTFQLIPVRLRSGCVERTGFQVRDFPLRFDCGSGCGRDGRLGGGRCSLLADLEAFFDEA